MNQHIIRGLYQVLDSCADEMGGFVCQMHKWPHGVTVSTLDSESNDRGSNPREAFLLKPKKGEGGRERERERNSR